MEAFRDLDIREENEKVILLNTNNCHWVKMKKSIYERIKESDDEERIIRYLDGKYGLFQNVKQCEKPNIKSIYFAVTNKCNMNCPFCSMNSGPNVSTKNDLSIQEITDTVLPKIKNFTPTKVVVSGGEPLVRKDLKTILKLFAEIFGKEKMVLQTNGLLMNMEVLKEIEPYVGAIEFSVEYFFDNSEMKNRLTEVFEYMVSKKIVLAFSFVVDRNTRKYLLDAIDLGHLYDAIFTMRMVSPVGRATYGIKEAEICDSKFILETYYCVVKHIIEKKYFDENISSAFLGNIRAKRHCGAFGGILAIRSNGDIKMCSNFKDEKYSIGNICDLSEENIVKALNDTLNDEECIDLFCVDKKEQCIDCEIKYFCSGPCTAELAENKRDVEDIFEMCYSKKILTKYMMFYFEKNKSDEENLVVLKEYIESSCPDIAKKWENKKCIISHWK